MRAINCSIKKILIIALFLINTVSVLAQDYAVKPLSDFLQSYKVKHNDISKTLEEDNGMSFTKKLAVYENKINKLKDAFKVSRKIEYEAKSVKRAKRATCEGKKTRGITDCNAVFIKAPNDKMYTKKEWITLEGSDKVKVDVIDNESIRLQLSATGTRTVKGVVYTMFKYKPELIAGIVEKDTDDLFEMIMHQ